MSKPVILNEIDFNENKMLITFDVYSVQIVKIVPNELYDRIQQAGGYQSIYDENSGNHPLIDEVEEYPELNKSLYDGAGNH